MDMELYRRLEDGKKEMGLSMPAYVKGLLRQHFKSAERAGTDVGVEACIIGVDVTVVGDIRPVLGEVPHRGRASPDIDDVHIVQPLPVRAPSLPGRWKR